MGTVSHLAERRIYNAARQRCTNPKSYGWQWYGAIGVEFRFKGFREFIEHIGPRPDASLSLDRIDGSGHYEIGNVRWADFSTQCRNRKSTRFYAAFGQTKCLKDWARASGVKYTTLYYRVVKKSQSLQEVLTLLAEPSFCSEQQLP